MAGEGQVSLIARVQDRLGSEETRRELQEFCESTVSPLFATLTPEELAAPGMEGIEHKHEWHAAYQEFVAIFERKLEDALAAESADRAAFLEECRAVAEGERGTAFDRMILTVLEQTADYEAFVAAMKELQRNNFSIVHSS
eukprot:TRINITY_DN68723_c0_g1_i2.p1 TRINITY_DN68723_c0_g1~~TRINITY_DN68723_c0_g1_i2.p1  ORF type:complete len:141 (-),score=27.10 TRINITY_DN68723_c0_g1_i2:247-669(-)